MSNQFRTVVGFVQFPPREGEAGGKPVRNITVRQAGFGPTAVNVSATLWPSHSHIDVNEGDYVALDGKYTQNTGTNKDGETVKYHNLSVTRFKNLGAGDKGAAVGTTNTSAEDEADSDDIPF